MAKVLVAGASGFIGKRLVYQLLELGHEVFALSRISGIGSGIASHPNCTIICRDVRDFKNKDPLPKEIDAAYYLIHSMGSVVQNLIEEEEGAARHFVEAVEETNCKQVIFLGGIIEDVEHLSPHLLSRLAVEKVLHKGRIPATILRASIIIGAGSASFEIIRDLVEKLPFMIAPKWVNSMCQPIAVRDVLFYLSSILLNKDSFGNTYDLGGPEVMSFKEVLLRYAQFRHLHRWVIDIPILTPRLSSYWLVLITSVRFSICMHLVESMKQNTRKLNCAIDQILPHQCISYEEALGFAFQKIAQNEIVSTWMDAWSEKTVRKDILEAVRVPEEGCLQNIQIVPVKCSFEEVLEKIWTIGGEQGWYSMDWAWDLRGLIDQLIGGIGMNRGRRHPSNIEVGDSIDFWRVLSADKEKGHLILYAEMKVPGEAWLEFVIDRKGSFLKQTATFRPKGFLGRIYWYSLWPFHWVIFRNMARAIARGLF